MNRKVCADNRKYQGLAATNCFRVYSGIDHNYFTCNALSRVVIIFHRFNRVIHRIVLACEVAVEYIYREVPEMWSYL